ncbi:p53-induced death domain-containing protein 1-like [Branchiostoma floridae]|uniref:P53-induced death domain-containing protein 1-like n=1 Tax=Branchiostoma floridae TaxID=7739 RepID=A0A9J7N7T0_BRAFL|nr:p53-induced death domain-containing protein 1-like [Branchiostoma floridae]
MLTEINCQVIKPNDITLPLKDGAMLLSDVIELGPHGTSFNKPVTVQMQYSSTSSGGAMEAVVLVTEDRSQWSELKTTDLSENKLAVSVDHFSTFAVISRPKQDTFPVSTEEHTLTSSTQPAVQISFPKQSVTTPTQVTVQVQEVPKRAVEDMKAKDQSSCGLVSTSPIVSVETDSDSAVQFLKPVTVRVPHPKRYMDIQHELPNKRLKVMSYEKGTEDWIDETDTSNPRESEELVEFEVSHCTRWIVIIVTDDFDDPKEFGPIPLKLCRWLQSRDVQFILLQRKLNANEFVIECTLEEDAERKHAALLRKGYKGPVPTGSVKLFEGQKVEIGLLGNVSIAPFSPKPQITFHSQRSNRLQMQVIALKAKDHPGLDGKGDTSFFALPRIEVPREKEQHVRAAIAKKGNKAVECPKPELLCQIPIHVSYETPKVASEHGAAASKGLEKYFYFVKEEVSTDWGDLAIHLGFKWADIRNIARRNPDDKSCCFDLLCEWQKREGDAATMEVLMEALSEAELQSVVDGFRTKFPDVEQQGERE